MKYFFVSYVNIVAYGKCGFSGLRYLSITRESEGISGGRLAEARRGAGQDVRTWQQARDGLRQPWCTGDEAVE